MINIYSDTIQIALKYLKDTKANIYNVLVIAGDFSNSWNSSFPFYLIHSDLLTEIADSFDISLSNPTNQIHTRYLDNIYIYIYIYIMQILLLISYFSGQIH